MNLFFEYMTPKDDQKSCIKLIFRCFECKKNYEKELIKRFANIYVFCNGDINKFILLFKKGVYPYEYMDSWERFDEISLPNKKDFYSGLYMEDITDVDYRHAKRVFNKVAPKNSNNENLGDYYDLYIQSDRCI